MEPEDKLHSGIAGNEIAGRVALEFELGIYAAVQEVMGLGLRPSEVQDIVLRNASLDVRPHNAYMGQQGRRGRANEIRNDLAPPPQVLSSSRWPKLEEHFRDIAVLCEIVGKK